MSDWLEAARRCADDALGERPGSVEEARLLRISTNHATIAIAEGLRALLGVIVGLPETERDDLPLP